MTSKEYRAIARQKLSGKWGNAILAGLIALYLGGLLTAYNVNINLNLSEETTIKVSSLLFYPFILLGISGLVSIAQFILAGPTRLGYCTYLLKLHDGRDAEVNDLFSQ